jgi:acetyltransferase-like isoleucine patch superfamily enzyme
MPQHIVMPNIYRKLHQKVARVAFKLGWFPPNLKVHPTSSIVQSKISLKTNCSLDVDECSEIGGMIAFDKDNAIISIGKRVFMGGHLIAANKIEIGDDVMISWNVTVVDHNSHSISFSERATDVVNWKLGKKDWTNVKTASVKISNKVWIGFNSIILKGVVIGEGAVIGAGSVVTRDVPPWTIVAGNPARVIREISENER